MGNNWTDTTWNPLRGCSRVSEGCRNCYAERIAARFSGPGQPYEGLAKRVNGEPRWTGRVKLVDERLGDPLRWKKPRRVFVNSMSDLFHESVPDEWIDQIFAVMALSPTHTFQCLTKRPARMRDYFRRLAREDKCLDGLGAIHGSAAPLLGETVTDAQWESVLSDDWPLTNVHLGVSVEDQTTADERIPLLLQTPAAVRFLSCEPLLEEVDLYRGGWSLLRPLRSPPRHGTRPEHISWVIVGGESGPGARHMDPNWARSIRDQCAAAGVPFFFKQMALKAPIPDDLMIREWPALDKARVA